MHKFINVAHYLGYAAALAIFMGGIDRNGASSIAGAMMFFAIAYIRRTPLLAKHDWKSQGSDGGMS